MNDKASLASRLKGVWEGLDTYWVRLIGPGAIIAIVILGLVLWHLLPNVESVSSPPMKGDLFEMALDGSQQSNAAQFGLWYKTNIVIQVVLIVTALLGTVFASLTTSENANSIKRWSVLVTAITAALTSAQATFHVRENMEAFVNAAAELNALEAEYLDERTQRIGPPDTASAPNAEAYKVLMKLKHDYTPRYNLIMSNRMRAWVSIGQPAQPYKDPSKRQSDENQAMPQSREVQISPGSTSTAAK